MKGKLAAAATGSTAIGAYELYSRYRRPKPLKGSYPEAPTKVLVIGGGFGGLAVVEILARTLGGSQEVGVACSTG
jgi:NADPH-dependent 2,4-dienoyl-CoA reductase/sulfur reductase-like enzyme